MSDLFYTLQEQALPSLRAGNLARCDAIFSDAMRSLPESPFHIALHLRFTNPPTEVAAHFDAFIRRETSSYEVAAIYTETNGFDINPDRWFFDLFAFEAYGGHEDYDWLADWKSDNFSNMTLTGMEDLQRVYASSAFRDRSFNAACYVTDLIVVSRFQQLIHESASLMQELHFPLLATSHDFEFISEVRPSNQQVTTGA